MTVAPNTVDLLHQYLVESDWESFVAHLRGIANLEEREKLQRELGRRHGQTIDLVERLRAWPVDGSTRAVTHLLPALLHAPITKVQLLQLLQFAAAAGGSARYRVTEVVRNAFVASPRASRDVGLAMRADHSLTPALSIWITAFVQAAPGDAAAYVTELPTETSSERELVANFLETLRPFLPSVVQMLAPHAERLLAAVLLEAPKIGLHFSVLWSAVRTLAHFYVPAMDVLMDASRAGQTPALIALANWLPGQSDSALGASSVPLSDVVDVLLQHSLSDEELRKRAVDSNLASLLYTEALRPIVISRVKRLASVDAPIAEMFSEVFNAIADHQGLFAALLTDWLLSASATLAAVRSVLAMCTGSRAPPVLDAPTFTAAPMDRQVVACRRLLNLTMDGPTLCEFIGLLAQESGFQPQGLRYASEMLPAAMDEFPGAAEDFLAPRTRADRRNDPYAPLYRAVYARALQWRRVLMRLPKLNELKPSDPHLHALRSMHVRHSQEVMRAARAQSILGQIATTVHTAQGRRFVSHLEPGPTGISGMVAQSHSFELPSSERSDPLGGLIRRRGGLRASR